MQYAYSAWAPQFAERLHLTSTQSNLIVSTSSGLNPRRPLTAARVPWATSACMLLAYRSDIWSIIKGHGPEFCLGAWRWALDTIRSRRVRCASDDILKSKMLTTDSIRWRRRLHERLRALHILLPHRLRQLCGISSVHQNRWVVLRLLRRYVLTRTTAALNWPLHRGTATAFPLAAFGLSAVFFTTLSHIFAGDDVSKYLLLLSIGTVILTFTSFFFITIPHSEQYKRLSQAAPRARRDSNRLEDSWHSKFSRPPRVETEPSK